MLTASATEKRRLRYAASLAALLSLGGLTPCHAQDAAKSPDAGKKPDPPAASKDAKDKDSPKPPAGDAAADDDETDRLADTVEVFKDPLAEQALKVFKSVPGVKDFPDRDIATIKSMAGNTTLLDRVAVRSFVQGMVYRITDRANLNSLLNPTAKQSASSARNLHNASANLSDMMIVARQAQNNAFLTVYSRELLDVLPKVLDTNLYSRTEAILILGQARSKDMFPVFLSQIKNPEQTLWVKLVSLEGITNILDDGRRADSILASQSNDATKAVIDLLDPKTELPWPLVWRGVETLGAVRLQQKAEASTVALGVLANGELNVVARAEAARTLGMLRTNTSVGKLNYALCAYHVGLLTVELGEKINGSAKEKRVQSQQWTSLLVGPLWQSLNGVDEVRDSGLLKLLSSTGSSPAGNFVRQVANLETSVARVAVELIRAPNGQIPAKKKELSDRLAELKSYLDKNAPADRRLTPDGSEFPGSKPSAPTATAQKNGSPVGQ